LPGATMAERGCRLVSLCVRHPNAAEIAQRLAPGVEDGRVRFETANTCEIVAEIETPSGLHRLS
ncbi:MAG: VOC family protein, partial [Pseudomonadota bacterium]